MEFNNEFLTFRCDKFPTNPAECLEKCIKLFWPRANDNCKSTWAFESEDPDLATLNVAESGKQYTICRRLHAVSLFVLQKHFNKDEKQAVRNVVEGVAFPRDPIKEFVNNEPDTHLIAECDATHRCLRFENEDARAIAVRRIVDSKAIAKWKYLRIELVALLRQLMDRGIVKNEFIPTAQAIMAEEPK